MRFLSLLTALILAACSTGDTLDLAAPIDNESTVIENNPKPEENIDSYTGELLRTNSIEFEIQLARGLSAFDIGPFLDYNRKFSTLVLPDNIVTYIKSLDVSLPPDEFALCGAVVNPETYIVRVTDSNGSVRTYMDEIACNVGVIGGLPQAEQIIGILVQAQLNELREMLLDFDPRVLNP